MNVKNFLRKYSNTWMPSIPEIRLFQTHDFPVYLIHNSADAEDYFFVFDFEHFDQNAKGARFTKPAFKILCGRTDFDRDVFGTHMRVSFEKAYLEKIEALAKAQSESKSPSIWRHLDTLSQGAAVASLLGGYAIAPLMMLWVGVSAVHRGKSGFVALLSKLKFQAPESAESLAQDIETKRGEVDTALSLISADLHPDLMVNAFGPGFVAAHADVQAQIKSLPAWPLPDHVTQLLQYSSADLTTP